MGRSWEYGGIIPPPLYIPLIIYSTVYCMILKGYRIGEYEGEGMGVNGVEGDGIPVNPGWVFL